MNHADPSDVIAIIPARYGSTRLAGKPLLRDTGKYLIQHVWERVAGIPEIGRVVIATDDLRIAAAAASFGALAAMTDSAHASGSDRVAEVARQLGLPAASIILNVQGDEPEIEPDCLRRLVHRMRTDTGVDMGTLAAPFPPEADPGDPNRVKVVLNRARRALYFSRARVPYVRESDADAASASAVGPWLHLGVYAYRCEFLQRMTSWPVADLERVERLEQLRVLENGGSIAVEFAQRAFSGIDTPADYEAFVKRWRGG